MTLVVLPETCVDRSYGRMASESVEYPGLGDRIRAARVAAGLSQRALAEMLDTDKSSIWKWERNGSVPGTHHMEGLERVLGVSRKRLLYGNGDGELASGDPPYQGWRDFVASGGADDAPAWALEQLRRLRFRPGDEPSEMLYRMTLQVWLTGVLKR